MRFRMKSPALGGQDGTAAARSIRRSATSGPAARGQRSCCGATSRISSRPRPKRHALAVIADQCRTANASVAGSKIGVEEGDALCGLARHLAGCPGRAAQRQGDNPSPGFNFDIRE